LKSEPKKKKRKTGRPSKSETPRVAWDEVEQLLVHGEKNEEGVIEYPSFRCLGERFDVAHSTIAKFAKQHNCLHRREQAEKNRKEMSDIKLSELRADKIAVKRDDMIRAMDRFIFKFEKALMEDRVRCDNPTDYNTIIRLRAFVLGDADTRNELVAGLTLDDLIAAHDEYRKGLKESTPEMRGEVVPFPDTNQDKDDNNDIINKEDREPPQ
jgi:uncharacterized protein YdcH (DUF465 family)